MTNSNTQNSSKKIHYLESELNNRTSSHPEIFDFLQQSVLDGVWVWDLEKPENRWMNEGFWNLLGFDPSTKAHLASEWQDLIFPQDLETILTNLELHKENPEHPFDQIVRYHHANKSTVWVRCRGMAIRDKDGKPIRLLGIVSDITELMLDQLDLTESKQALEVRLTEQLRELEFQKSALDEHAIVSIADVKGNITYVNDKFCEISGYEREELIGQNHRILKSGEHSAFMYEELWKTIANGKTWNGKLKNLKKGGKEFYWVWATIIPVMNEKNKPTRYVSIRTDLTDQILAEERLKIAKQEAEEANRAKSDFLANMSHELRTPLNAVIGFAEFVELGTTNKNMNPEKIKAYARSIGSAGRDLLRLINDLLDFAKIEAKQFDLSEAPFLLAEEIDNIASTFEVKALENNVTLKVFRNDMNYTVFGDAMRMRQVVFNLLDNAIKFSKGGKVTVQTTATSIDHDMLALEVLIEDSGIGIEKDRIEQIFDPFAQSDSSIARDFGGTGLGLPISRHLSRLMGGDVSVISKIDQGSTFSATFVFRDLTKLHKSLSLLGNDNPTYGNARLGLSVLAVDDVETNLDVLETMLDDMECSIYKVRNGQEAIEWTKDHSADVILMDLHMPVLDGVSAARIIKKMPGAKSQIPIYAWTADVTSKKTLKSSNVDWAGTILKPTTRNSLLLALKHTANQRHN